MARAQKRSWVGLLSYAIMLWLASLWLAWWLLAQSDFLYGAWYEWLDIEQTIAQYAPQNRYRQSFEQTTRVERKRLMSALVTAIHHHGEGLETLRYHDSSGNVLGKFLRPPEILHLHDVSALVNQWRWLGWTALFAWLLTSLAMFFKATKPPSLARVLLSLSTLLAMAGLAILLIGPLRVFYQLHVWIFPPGHPWFFYYQDSLMTTLLKAPDIFGPITLSWLLLSLVLLVGLLGTVRFIYQLSSRD